MSDSDHSHQEDAPASTGVGSSEVVSKYRSAADILKSVLEKLGTLVVKPGTKIVQLCQVGDALILKEVAKVFTKKVGPKHEPIKKGIAFPTCVSVNNVVGHFSPLPTNEQVLKEGDIVKVDMGVHIDGYACVAAHTYVCGDAKVTDRAADVVMAAYTAAEAVLRLIKPGVANSEITEMIGRVAKQFDVRPVQGVLSHSMDQNEIDGNKTILSYSDAETKVEKCEFEVNDVFAIDIVMSTGEGKPREVDEKTMVFKRIPNSSYKLKMKASRNAFSEMNAKHGAFPFTVRSFEDVTRARLGMNECERHKIVQGYPVLFEKDGELVAHFKYTVLLLSTGALRISGMPFDTSRFEPSHDLQDEEIQKLLDTPVQTTSKKKKKNKKKKKKPAAADTQDQE